jgi:hypothetical protein
MYEEGSERVLVIVEDYAICLQDRQQGGCGHTTEGAKDSSVYKSSEQTWWNECSHCSSNICNLNHFLYSVNVITTPTAHDSTEIILIPK